MAYQTIGECGLWLPRDLGDNAASSASSAISATAHIVAHHGIVVTPGYGTKTINKVHWYPESLTAAGGSTLRVSLQDWDLTNGQPARPDGVVDQYRTQNINTVTVSTWNSTGLVTTDGTDGGGKRSVSNGDRLCVVWDFTSYAGADAVGISHANVGWFQTWQDSIATYNGSVWASTSAGSPGNTFFEFSDGTYGSFLHSRGRQLAAGLQLRSDTTPDELGNTFTLPSNASIAGVWTAYTGDTNDFDVVLYDGTTAMSGGTASVDKDTANDANTRRVVVWFPTPVKVRADQQYRWAVKPGGTTSAAIYYSLYPSVDAMATSPGGVNMYYTGRTDAGSWTDTTNRKVWGGLIIGEFECGGHANYQLGV